MAKGNRLKEIAESIEKAILTGTLQPGDRLDERKIAEQHSVSRTPVREAILLLASSDLVELRPNQGAIVSIISTADALSLGEANAGVEGLCAKYAARRLTAKECKKIEILLVKSEACVTANDIELYWKLNNEFHEIIKNGCHNKYLEQTAQRLQNKFSALRRSLLNTLASITRSHEEHKAIAEAILNGDADESEKRMNHHLNVQRPDFIDLLSTIEKT